MPSHNTKYANINQYIRLRDDFRAAARLRDSLRYYSLPGASLAMQLMEELRPALREARRAALEMEDEACGSK